MEMIVSPEHFQPTRVNDGFFARNGEFDTPIPTDMQTVLEKWRVYIANRKE
jgi:hypothetical protein